MYIPAQKKLSGKSCRPAAPIVIRGTCIEVIDYGAKSHNSFHLASALVNWCALVGQKLHQKPCAPKHLPQLSNNWRYLPSVHTLRFWGHVASSTTGGKHAGTRQKVLEPGKKCRSKQLPGRCKVIFKLLLRSIRPEITEFSELQFNMKSIYSETYRYLLPLALLIQIKDGNNHMLPW